jgi:predicted kinase
MLYIIRGLPGSGKSTYAKKLRCFHVEADMYFMRDGVYQFNKDSIKDAHNWCYSQVTNSLLGGMDVSVSNTFTQLWEVNHYIALANRYNIPYQIITLVNDFGNVHNVPHDTINKMKARWEPIGGETIITFTIV